jgi:hypothetical protein
MTWQDKAEENLFTTFLCISKFIIKEQTSKSVELGETEEDFNEIQLFKKGNITEGIT